MQQQVSICADCSSQSCEWCSVNRGVYLCVQCAAVHRQLGRHVSQVKHVTRSSWRPSQLRMVHELAQAGANYIWEHLLLDPSAQQSTPLSLMHVSAGDHPQGKKQLAGGGSGTAMWKKRKPMPHDSMHPTKVEFIREKYMFAAFFKRNTHTSQDDMNQQLYASVRTNMVTTSLQLLAMGANPNFWNPIRGNTPLHVACQCNQVSQAELLITYGASLNRKDANGNTPLMIAFNQEQKHSGSRWSPLIACLIEAHYEVCDTLSLYLNQRVPDHSQVGQHFLVPALPPVTNTAQLVHHQQSLLRLAHLDQQAFVDFSMDVYDDVMRRLTNRLVAGNQDYYLFFLPLHREYSSTRNQARQKLARLGDDDTMTGILASNTGSGELSCGFRCVEFAALVWDVLWESRRRMTLAVTGNGLNNRLSSVNQWQHVMSTSGVATPDGEGDGPPVVLRAAPQAGVSSAGRFSFVPQQSADSGLAMYQNPFVNVRERFVKDIAPTNHQDNMTVGQKRNSLPGLGSTDFIQEEEEASLSRPSNDNAQLSTALSNIDSLLLDPVYDHVPFDTSSEHAFSGDLTDSSYVNPPLPDSLISSKHAAMTLFENRATSSPLREIVKVNREQQTDKCTPAVTNTASQTSSDYQEEMERFRRLMEEWKTQKSVLEERNAQQQQTITKLEMEVAKLLEEKMRAWSVDHLYPSSTSSTISSTPNISNSSPHVSSPLNLPAAYTSGNPLWINTGVRMHQEVMGVSGSGMLSRSNPQAPLIHDQRKEFTGSNVTESSSPINRPYHMVNMKLPPPYRASPQLMSRDEYQKPVHPISRAPSSQPHHPMAAGSVIGANPAHPHTSSSSAGSIISTSSESQSQFTVSQQDRLVTHVNYIASLVKQLLEFGQHNCRDEFVRCACQIQTAVEEMTHFMPTHVSGVDRQELVQALQAIMLHSRELRRQCENAVKQTSDTNLTHFITCAHDIIMATRSLLTSIYRLDR